MSAVINECDISFAVFVDYRPIRNATQTFQEELEPLLELGRGEDWCIPAYEEWIAWFTLIDWLYKIDWSFSFIYNSIHHHNNNNANHKSTKYVISNT